MLTIKQKKKKKNMVVTGLIDESYASTSHVTIRITISEYNDFVIKSAWLSGSKSGLSTRLLYNLYYINYYVRRLRMI